MHDHLAGKVSKYDPRLHRARQRRKGVAKVSCLAVPPLGSNLPRILGVLDELEVVDL